MNDKDELDTLQALIELMDRTEELIMPKLKDKPPFDLDAHARRLKDPTLYYQPCPADWWANFRNRS